MPMAREGQCSGLSPSNSTHVNMRAKAAANSGWSHYCSSLCLNSFFKSIPIQGRVKTPYGKPALKRVQISRHIFSWKRKADVTSICVMGHPRLAAADIKIVTSPGWKTSYSCLLAGNKTRFQDAYFNLVWGQKVINFDIFCKTVYSKWFTSIKAIT